MNTPALVALVSVGIIFVWGFLSPRTQWRALVSWSYRDPYLNEPTGFAYILYRGIAMVGIAGMVISGVLVYQAEREAAPVPPVPPTTAELMWGNPEPVVVNRVVTSVSAPPAGLVNQPILGYQDMTGRMRQPPYLFSLKTFAMADAVTENGYIGADPNVGLVALDSAKLVVRVAGDPKCFPHAAIVRETTSTVTVAIYYARAIPTGAGVDGASVDGANVDGADVDGAAQCNVLASARNISTIIPIPLVEPLGKRHVVALDGSPIRRVEMISTDR